MDNATAVTEFVLGELLDDDDAVSLDRDYDLVGNGVLDSLGLLQLMGWLQDEFSISLEHADMTDFQSVDAICELIASAQA